MALIKWDESFSVNIDTIDEQHKRLIAMLNEFYDNIESKSSKENIGHLLSKMKGYTVHHFQAEEWYLKQYNYPEYDHHKGLHNEFIEKVTDIEKRFREGELVLSFEITDFLKNWLKNHIKGTDRRYSEFLIEKGVK
jgi:hemerythrin